MKTMIKPAIKIFLVFTILCGIVYPLVVTGFAQLFFPDKANGDITLLGQNFTEAGYLIGRPSEGINLSPTSEVAEKLVEERKEFFKTLDPANNEEIPKDLLSSSGSGFDPNISIEGAEYQIERIARVRNIETKEVSRLIEKYTNNRFLYIFGEPSVNVLKVNMALDDIK